MIPHRMTNALYLKKNILMFFNIISDAKKCCLCIILLQLFQHKFCWSGNRAIIKSQINHFLIRIHPPQKISVACANQLWWLYEKISHDMQKAPEGAFLILS